MVIPLYLRTSQTSTYSKTVTCTGFLLYTVFSIILLLSFSFMYGVYIKENIVILFGCIQVKLACDEN